ncbi:MAG TPA: DUF4350 domain-containing protein [Candidatus Rubrimentiphilum sp.]|nr:DUF4350 domain-containing protein [Candidatus Rubrimentiphilum sp.]
MRNRTEIAVLIAALLLFTILSALQAAAPRAHSSFPSTYDTGANGYAALYEFLQRESVRPERYELPLAELPARATVVFAGDYTIDSSIFSAKTSAALDKWVRRGGKLIVLGSIFPYTRDALGLPKTRVAAGKLAWTACGFRGARRVVAGDFPSVLRTACDSNHSVLLTARGGAVAVSLKRGRGTIVEVVTPAIFDNAQLAAHDNAAFAYDLFASAGSPLFDERVYGYAAGRTFWEVMPRPVIAAAIVALIALLLAIAAANVRLAPARSLERNDERDSLAYIESLARMLQRGGAAHDVIARLGRAAAGFRSPPPGDERGRAAFDELRRLGERRDAGPRDVLLAGTIFAQLRKDYEW